MDVSIKQFDVAMNIKTKGIELEVRTPNGETRLGGPDTNKDEADLVSGTDSAQKRPQD